MDTLELNTVKEFGAYFTAWFDWDIDEKSFWLSGLFYLFLFKKKWHKKPIYQYYNLSISQPIAKYYHSKNSPKLTTRITTIYTVYKNIKDRKEVKQGNNNIEVG